MRRLTLLAGLVSGVAVGLIVAHWLGFDLLNASEPAGGAVAAAAGGLGGGIGLALVRSRSRTSGSRRK